MGCQQLATMKGVFFEISVPVKSDIFSFIPWNKMEQKWFGVNRNGIFSIDGNTGEVCVQVYSQDSTYNYCWGGRGILPAVSI